MESPTSSATDHTCARTSIRAFCVCASLALALPGCGRAPDHPPRVAATAPGGDAGESPTAPGAGINVNLPNLDLAKSPDPQGPQHAGEAAAISALAGSLDSQPRFNVYQVVWGLYFADNSNAFCGIRYVANEERLHFGRGNMDHAEEYDYYGATRERVRQLSRRQLPIIDDLVRLGCSWKGGPAALRSAL